MGPIAIPRAASWNLLAAKHDSSGSKAIDALEIKSGSDEVKIANTVDYVSNSLGVPIPFIFGSDSHDCASVNVGMWVKMADLTITSPEDSSSSSPNCGLAAPNQLRPHMGGSLGSRSHKEYTQVNAFVSHPI